MSRPHAMSILPGLIHFILIHFAYIFLIIYRIEIVRKLIKIKTECQGSTLTVFRLPGASEMRLRASENGTQLVRSGK